MADIKPFRGIRYNQEVVGDLSQVISQPYDRVRYGLQDVYYELHEKNVVRIIRGKEQTGDSLEENIYTRAKGYLSSWLEDGTLVRDDEPALYVFHQQFQVPGGGDVTRKAFICALELVEFDEGTVLPHERTHSGPKVDRLNLTRATETYFGNIFMLYPDPQNKVDSILASALERAPDVDVTELHEKHVRQKMWVVKDREIIDAVIAEMSPKRNLIIADGHHRYETALNYRKEQQAKHPEASETAAFGHRMVTLVSMSNPGLTILPTHRLIRGHEKVAAKEFLEKAAVYFEIKRLPNRAALEGQLVKAAGRAGQIGLATEEGFYLLGLKDLSVMDRLAPDRTLAWKELDVSILHELILEELLGLTKEGIEQLENISYLREPDMGYEEVATGESQFLFVLNPTKIEQVIACTDAGEKMPQKSTDFYPKVVTGLVMLPVGAGEKL